MSVREIRRDERIDLKLIHKEFKDGFELIKKYPRSVTFFGSARLREGDEHYEEATKLAEKIARELKYTVITGGGPGIMQAANKGAFDAGGTSIGLCINLPHEQASNKCLHSQMSFRYFFTRKTILTFAAEAFIFFPGGFGTLDEFFDVLTLVQTGKIPKVPIILVGEDYWRPLDAFIRQQLLAVHKTIGPADAELYRIMSSHDEIIAEIKKTPVQNWWKEFEK